MRYRKTGALLTLLAALTAILSVVAASASAAQSSPIVIGWAFDSKGNMAPFDDPALAAAKVRVGQINAAGGVLGRKLVIRTCDTQNNNPAKAKSCAASLIGGGANIVFTTCDVDYATPVVQEAINRGILAVAPCIGTDQMGPKRFGAKGKLAFSFGNVAQDEGSAMAQYAWSRGWKTAATATNTLLVYFKNVVQAFEARFTQLGGKIVDRESYATGANNVNNAVSRLNGVDADVVVTSTSFGELPALVAGLRTLGNNVPIMNSWAGDGTYWLPEEPVDLELLRGDVRVGVRGRSQQGGERVGEEGQSGDRRVRHRCGRDRRRRHRDQAGEGLHERRPPRSADGEVQEGAHDLRARELLTAAPHGVRASVPRAAHREQQAEDRRNGDGEGRPEDLKIERQLTETSQSDGERWPGAALRATAVSRSFEGVRALEGVTTEVRRTEVVGLIGPNGAGKSTLVNVLSGFDAPTSGTVELDGEDVTRWPAHRRGRAGLARTFQHSRSFRSLSVRENVEIAAIGTGTGPREARRRADDLLELLGLDRRADASASSLPHGDERRLGVARALATEPRYVLMDEPAAGLTEAEVPAFAAVVRAVRDDHEAGVLLIDHNMALIMDVCDRIQVLDQGRVLAEGTPADIRANLDVAAAYLGESAVAEECAPSGNALQVPRMR